MTAPKTDRAAIRQVVRALRAAGYVLDYVHDGEEDVKVSNETEALEAVMAVDDAFLFVTHATERSSHVRFVLGNDPEECPADWGVSLEPVLDPLTRSWW